MKDVSPRLAVLVLVSTVVGLMLVGCQAQGQPQARRDAWALAEMVKSRPAGGGLSVSNVAEVRRGEEVFLNSSCALCHAVRGTRALASVGPDLTHLAGRRTLASGTLPNTRGNLAGWILNPQNLKPGTKMPATQLTPEELHALLAFLERLE